MGGGFAHITIEEVISVAQILPAELFKEVLHLLRCHIRFCCCFEEVTDWHTMQRAFAESEVDPTLRDSLNLAPPGTTFGGVSNTPLVLFAAERKI